MAGPEAAALLLATALDPLRKAAGLERAAAVALHAASGSGEPAVRELESEVADLMNGRDSQENGLELVVAADNLRPGAASNAVALARLLAEKGL